VAVAVGDVERVRQDVESMMPRSVVPEMARKVGMPGVDTAVDDRDDDPGRRWVERGESVLPGRLRADSPQSPLMPVQRIVDDEERPTDPVRFG
jgi:hypothetical protein